MLTYSLVSIGFVACSPDLTSNISETETTRQMRSEFMESCRARSEYVSQKRSGTLDKLCTCVFDKTMKGLTQAEQITAGFYLYGETHEGFKARLQTTPLDPETMIIAAEAVGKAAQICH